MTVCKTCGVELLAERAELGFDYCTAKNCQRANYQGMRVTAVQLNKSGVAFVFGDDIEKRAANGEFAKKNGGLGSNDLSVPMQSASLRVRTQRSIKLGTQRPSRRRWTDAQAQYVRAKVALGCTPQQIALDSGRLRIGVSMAIDIMGTLPRRTR